MTAPEVASELLREFAASIGLTPAAVMVERVDFFNATAIRYYNMPDGWQWRLVSHSPDDCPPGYMLVAGTVSEGFYQRGPRMGQIKWPPSSKWNRLFIADAHIDATRDAYELATRRCSRCQGKGSLIWGENAYGDKKYQPCRDCGGTGNARHIAKQQKD